MPDIQEIKAKVGKKDFDDFVNYCVSRFREGNGVTLNRKGKKVFFIPEVVCDPTEGVSGIVVCYEGGGAYVYRGERELNEYVLVSAHFPLQVAREVSKIINALITHYDRMKNDVLTPETKRVDDPLLLTHEPKGTKND
jgi:hypothetical protein